MSNLFLLKYATLSVNKYSINTNNKNNNLCLDTNVSNKLSLLDNKIPVFVYENIIDSIIPFFKIINLNVLRYQMSFHNSNNTVWIKIKNKVSNGYGTIVYNNKIIYKQSIGNLNSLYKEEKYGNWLLSRKLQRFLLLYKWKKKNNINNLIVCCTGMRRFFRSSLGHITQLLIKLLKRYNRILRRYQRWILKFVRIAGRLRRFIILTHRQRSHTMWLRYNMKNKKKQLMLVTQLRLMKSYSNNISKVSKRKGKFSFSY